MPGAMWLQENETREMRTDEHFNHLVLIFIEKEIQQVCLMTFAVFIISRLRCKFHICCLNAGTSVRRESSQTATTEPLLLLSSFTQGLLG